MYARQAKVGLLWIPKANEFNGKIFQRWDTDTVEQTTWSNAILIQSRTTTISARALLDTHRRERRKHKHQLDSWKQETKIFKRKSCCSPKKGTISLLIDDIGHEPLSAEAHDRTFASSVPRSSRSLCVWHQGNFVLRNKSLKLESDAYASAWLETAREQEAKEQLPSSKPCPQLVFFSHKPSFPCQEKKKLVLPATYC